jgi:hypothetical protein
MIRNYLLIIITALLSGCHFQPLPDPSCVERCNNIANKCQKHEHFVLKGCQIDQSAYKINIKEQHVKGQEVTRELNSYRDPLQCSNDTINCNEDYQACAQLCKGKLYKRLVSPVS